MVNVTTGQAAAKVRAAGAVARIVAYSTAELESVRDQLSATLPSDAAVR